MTRSEARDFARKAKANAPKNATNATEDSSKFGEIESRQQELDIAD